MNLAEIPLADRLWTRAEVAEYLRKKPRTMERYSQLPNFPRPAIPGNPKVYRAADIIEWARCHRD